MESRNYFVTKLSEWMSLMNFVMILHFKDKVILETNKFHSIVSMMLSIY